MTITMPDDFLFPMPVVLSPRRAWLQKHGLTLTRLKNNKWACADGITKKACGDTQDDACIAFCLKFKVRHWNLE